jgi:hypothetical protein
VPLYAIGCGDLGMKAAEFDAALTRVFDVATAWKAIVSTDKGSVITTVKLLMVINPHRLTYFLKQHSLYNLERNAMVMVL